jgi:UDP-glucose:(heptosyl)LPS alpha-1,3-glucosyltransferase
LDQRRFNPDVVTLNRAEQRAKLDVPEDVLLILFAGINWRRKGLATIIRALALLGVDARRCRLVAVGKGRRRRFAALARKLGVADRVTLLEHVDKIERYYAAADVFVLPSLYDSFGLVCLEAMACGLAVVTTATTGASELIDHGRSGFVMADATDAQALAGYLRQLFDAPRRAEIGARAAARARQLTWEAHMRVWLDAIGQGDTEGS